MLHRAVDDATRFQCFRAVIVQHENSRSLLGEGCSNAMRGRGAARWQVHLVPPPRNRINIYIDK